MKITRLTREITKTVCVAVLALGAMFSFTSLAMADTDVTVSGIVAIPKIYNGLTSVELNFDSATLSGISSEDELYVSLNHSGYTANFSDENVGSGKSVIISGLILYNSTSTVYNLIQPTDVVGNITAKEITINPNSSQTKTYGTSDPVFGYELSEALIGDDQLSGVLGRVEGENVGAYNYTLGTLSNPNYSLTLGGSETFSITQANQTITFPEIPNKTFGDSSFTVNPTTGSGLVISFVADGNCGVNSSGLVTINSAGTCSITASQAGDTNYNPATSVSRTFTISPAQAIVTLNNLLQKYDGSPKQVTVTTNPGGLDYDITYSNNNSTTESPFTAQGVYGVTVNITNPNYTGTASGTLVIDGTAPVIDIDSQPANQINSQTASVSFSSEEGATFQCKLDDGEYSACTSPKEVNNLSEGAHTISIEATDSVGNISGATDVSFTVDLTPPRITINSYNTSPTKEDVIVTASTNEGALNEESHTFTENGSFNFIATDVAGNSTTETVTITNIDKTAPVITLVGEANVTVEAGSVYIESGATANDNVDGDITPSSIAKSGTVNTSVLGNYTITYNVSDSVGNPAVEVSRIVTVVDTTPPVITAPISQSFEATDTLTEPILTPATATDIVDQNPTITYEPHTLSLGQNTVTWTATDDEGNSATTTSEVTIVDTTKPTISLTGENPQTIEFHSSYVELGATATDNYNTSLTVIPNASEVDTEIVGTYSVTYDVTDSNGNIADTVTRIINVTDTTKPIITLGSYTATSTNQDITVTASTNEGILNAESHTFTENGSFTFTAIDVSNNSTNTTVVINNIDKIAPVLSITATSSRNTNTPDISGTSDQNATVTVNGVNYSVNSGSWIINVTNPLADGVYTVSITATDSAQNTTTVTKEITIDTTKPTVSSYLPSSGALDIALTNPITLTFSEPININESNVVFSPSFTDFIVTGSGTNQITITPSSNLASNTNYSVVISGVEDLVGNVIQNSHDDINFTTITAYSIPLYHRENNSWNLISLPVTPTNSNIATVLGNASTKIDAVWTYDPSNPNSVDGWLSYFPNDPTETNNLTSMSAGYGYWINANDDASVSGLGTLLSVGPNIPASRSLSSGWNLIGYYQLSEETSSTPASSFTSLGGEYSALWGFQNEGGSFKNVGLSSTITPGEAFWISLPSTKEYTPANQNN